MEVITAKNRTALSECGSADPRLISRGASRFDENIGDRFEQKVLDYSVRNGYYTHAGHQPGFVLVDGTGVPKTR